MLALCACTLAALTGETIFRPAGKTRQLLVHADSAVCGIFLPDFFISLYRAQVRVSYLLTWGRHDLLSTIPMLDAARWGRTQLWETGRQNRFAVPRQKKESMKNSRNYQRRSVTFEPR